MTVIDSSIVFRESIDRAGTVEENLPELRIIEEIALTLVTRTTVVGLLRFHISAFVYIHMITIDR